MALGRRWERATDEHPKSYARGVKLVQEMLQVGAEDAPPLCFDLLNRRGDGWKDVCVAVQNALKNSSKFGLRRAVARRRGVMDVGERLDVPRRDALKGWA